MFDSRAAPLLAFAAVVVPFFLLVLAWEVGLVGFVFGLLWRFIMWAPTFAVGAFFFLFFMLHPAMMRANIHYYHEQKAVEQLVRDSHFATKREARRALREAMRQEAGGRSNRNRGTEHHAHHRLWVRLPCVPTFRP